MKKVDKIEKSNYTGYIWFSNAKEPEVFYETEKDFSFNNNQNPFVIEGWLTDSNKSFHIQYVDDKHNIYEYDLNELKEVKYKEQRFMPSFKDFKELAFNQYWRPETDKLCEDMQVLVPYMFVFHSK